MLFGLLCSGQGQQHYARDAKKASTWRSCGSTGAKRTCGSVANAAPVAACTTSAANGRRRRWEPPGGGGEHSPPTSPQSACAEAPNNCFAWALNLAHRCAASSVSEGNLHLPADAGVVAPCPRVPRALEASPSGMNIGTAADGEAHSSLFRHATDVDAPRWRRRKGVRPRNEARSRTWPGKSPLGVRDSV